MYDDIVVMPGVLKMGIFPKVIYFKPEHLLADNRKYPHPANSSLPGGIIGSAARYFTQSVLITSHTLCQQDLKAQSMKGVGYLLGLHRPSFLSPILLFPSPSTYIEVQ